MDQEANQNIVDKQSNNNRNMTESSPNLTRVMADGAEDVGGIVEGAGDMDQNYNMENQSITSGSSVEPRSDLSYTDTEPNVTTNEEKSSELLLNAGRESVMSDYLATHMVPLPDLSVVATESEMEDDYMSVTSSAVGDSAWENNWLFKKKKPSLAGGSISTSSVGMLVPDPKEDVRAQIGDKTADEISDLSELGSDTDDSSMDLLRANMDPVNNRLFNKHLIGGQNSKMVLDELIERSSMISNTLPLDQEEAYAETRNVDVDVPSKNEAINTNVSQQNNNNNNSDNNNQEDQKNLEVLNPPLGFGDHSSSNPLADQLSINNTTSQTDDDEEDCGKSLVTSTEDMEDLTLSTDENEEKRNQAGDTIVDKLEETNTIEQESNRDTTTTTTRTIDLTNTTTTTTNTTTNTNSTNITANETITNNDNDDDDDNKLASQTNTTNTGSMPPTGTDATPTHLNTPITTNNTSDIINPEEQLTHQLTQITKSSNSNGSSNEKMAQDLNKSLDDDDDENDQITTLRKFLPGSIAEREYKKWYNAVEMPNNPYAPEALKRRISGSQERFIDLPNINASTDLSPLEMLTKEKVEADEANQRENEYRRYSRDYYINDGSAKSSQVSSPVRDMTNKDVTEVKPSKSEQPSAATLTVPETTKCTTQPQAEVSATVSDLYKAIPAQAVVVEDTTTSSSSLDTMSQQSLQSVAGAGGATTSDDSDTIKIYNFKKQETTTLSRDGAKEETPTGSGATKKEETTSDAPAKERPTMLNISRQESTTPLSTGNTPTRGSTPPAFKFLQPKRKLLNPSQVLSQDDDEEQPCQVPEKPVIEKEVVHALPSVKALARAFLMTSSWSQHSAERIWPRKAKTIPGQLKTPTKSVVKPIESPKADVDKSEEDATIASDLSSLETDPSSAGKTPDDAKDQKSPTTTPANTPTTVDTVSTTTATPTTTPSPVRQGVLKSNIAFFENLKFK